jgi:hypothetical protein
MPPPATAASAAAADDGGEVDTANANLGDPSTKGET